jgi:hypothetical protein
MAAEYSPVEKAEQHYYHDYANEAEMLSERNEDQRSMEHHHTQTDHVGEANFPAKLHYMLTELETDGMDDIVSWQPHGRCFIVHKQQQFLEKVLPL